MDWHRIHCDQTGRVALKFNSGKLFSQTLSTNRGVPSSPVVRTAISGQATESAAAVYRIYNAVADRTIPQDPNLPNDQQFVNGLKLLGQQVAYGKSTIDKGAADLQTLIEQMSKK